VSRTNLPSNDEIRKGYSWTHPRGPIRDERGDPVDVNTLEDILADAESDGIIGPYYTPRALAQYIVDSINEGEK
jgi:hypothetical protein